MQNVLIFGASGMVGQGVLRECLLDPQVQKVQTIGRSPSGQSHAKLQEVVHNNMWNYHSIEAQLTGFDACFFCLGISSIGMKEPDFYKVTYTLTMHFANTVSIQNNAMTFCYISGASTDSTEKGKVMWARVKGKTENDLMKVAFKAVYNFRPGYMQPTKGLKNTLGFYKYVSWMYPLLKRIFPNRVSTLSELGQAMINAALKGYTKNILEVNDIKALAKA